MRKYYKVISFLILFIFILVFNLVFVPNNLDEIWNYGFSYAIRLGEIPYRDFNMVLTPLYSFIMSIPLFIKNSYLSFVIFHAFIGTIGFYLLYKLIDKKVYFILLISLMFFPLIYPTYNYFFLFLMIVICYFENKEFKYKDYLVGLLIACCVLTKQSVGLFYIIPSLFFFKKNNINILKRFIGFIIPNFIFLLYLLYNKCLFKFFDLCLFGLFDFYGNSNGLGVSFIIFIIILLVSVVILIKNNKNINNYYILISYLLYVPLFDNLHLFYVLFSFGLLIFININDFKLKYELVFYPCLIAIVLILGNNMNVLNFKKNNLKHFEYKNISLDNVKYSRKIISYIKENDSIIYNDDAYFYRICANQKIGYLDLLNHGNHGYNGSSKIIKLIKENKNMKYLINKNLESRIKNKETQLDYDGYNYIISNARVIGEIQDYYVYSFE